MHQERIKVGPFNVSNSVNESDLRLIQYVFEESCWTIFSSPPRVYLNQSEFTTLKPQTHLSPLLIDIFAYILTETEMRTNSKHLNWYLPVAYSNALNNGNISSFRGFVLQHNMIDSYISSLVNCHKIFIPVRVEKNSCEHYYLYIIHMKNEEVEVWDPLSNQFINKAERDQITQKLLFAMDTLLGEGMFTKFNWRMARNIPLMSHGYDCGIFIINYMQQSDNYVRKKPIFQFDSDEERYNLALKLLKSDLNQEKATLHDKAARSQHYTQVKSEEDFDLFGMKKKRVDTCKTSFQDVEIRGAYMELDSNNTVKRNNVGWKTECVKGYMLPTTDLVGKDVQRHIQQIWKWIMENEVSTIGIWGMGGVGKTALATHVHNKLLEEAGDHFDNIIWITVSQFHNSIYQLQKAIATSINLDIYDECDVKRISGILLQASKHLNRCVLILDDVCDPIFLDEVGFPVSNDRIKLILTTRSWEVCQIMNCMKNTLNVRPLDEEDSWNLLQKTLGIHQIESGEVEPIARTVANQCGGLPLAILGTGRSIKGKNHTREWKHLLEFFQDWDSFQHHMDEGVFSVLKSSYACLNDKLQRFFLYYALSACKYAYGSYVDALIRKFYYEGWTYETKSLEMQYNEGYTMLNKLKNNSMLTGENGGWRMNTLLRVMAINIAKKTGEIMARTDMNLREIPESGEWKAHLQKAYLSGNYIDRISNGTSPKCSKLSALHLDHNFGLKWIPDDFFSNMPAIEILDLSRTSINRLPESVSNLECLIALLLSGCDKLSCMPSLAKLQRLIELDLSFTAISETPCGLELLVKLRFLNLEGTEQLKMSSATISKMTHLQSLRLMNRVPELKHVSVQDLQGLTKLEVISVNFCGIEEFNAYVRSFPGKDHKLKGYCLNLATLKNATLFLNACSMDTSKDYHSKRVVVCGTELGIRAALLPEDISELSITKCDNWTRTTCLCCVLSFNKDTCNLSRIEWLKLTHCKKLEYLCCVSPICSFCTFFKLVGRLSLYKVKDLKQIVAPYSSPFLDSPISYLTILNISECNKMKFVMRPQLFAQLQALETIHIDSCELLEEIVGENDCYRSAFTTITLPKLRYVNLRCLPALNFLFRGIILCPSLNYFEAYSCEKLSFPRMQIVQGQNLYIQEVVSTGYYWIRGNQGLHKPLWASA